MNTNYVNHLREYTVLRCPLCDYLTGISTHEWGLANARGALVNHLVRKRHQMARPEANVLAKQQDASRARYDSVRDKYEILKENGPVASSDATPNSEPPQP